MNTRIETLAYQAGYRKDMFGIGHWHMPECQRFAELIIRKCAARADVAVDNHCEWIGGNILAYFGVEE